MKTRNGLTAAFAGLVALASRAGEKVKRAPQSLKTAAVAAGIAAYAALPASAAVGDPITPDYAAMVTATKVNFLDVVAQGGPGVFLLMGVTAGISWIFLKVRSVAH